MHKKSPAYISDNVLIRDLTEDVSKCKHLESSFTKFVGSGNIQLNKFSISILIKGFSYYTTFTFASM